MEALSWLGTAHPHSGGQSAFYSMHCFKINLTPKYLHTDIHYVYQIAEDPGSGKTNRINDGRPRNVKEREQRSRLLYQEKWAWFLLQLYPDHSPRCGCSTWQIQARRPQTALSRMYAFTCTCIHVGTCTCMCTHVLDRLLLSLLTIPLLHIQVLERGEDDFMFL